MIGGELLATGSSSCIIKPSIPCKGKKTPRNNKKISKIVFGKKSKEYTKLEKHIDDILDKIPNNGDWRLDLNYVCKPPNFKDSVKIDEEIYECLGDSSNFNNKSKINQFDKNSIMLVGDYGGQTMESYFENLFDNPKENIKNIEKKFLDFMMKLDKLFYGLVQLKNNKLSHLDIKSNNIVITNNKSNFKFIDFGLSAEYKNLKHFKKRAYTEAHSKRMYLYYPPEFLYSQNSDEELKELINDLETKSFESIKKYLNIYKIIYNFFDRDAKLSMVNILRNYLDPVWKSDFTKIITKVDVYSLGILIPLLFHNNEILERVKESDMLKEFFSLLSLMTTPLYIYRIDIENAYILYKGLMEKFSKKKSKKTFKKKSNKKNKSLKGGCKRKKSRKK